MLDSEFRMLLKKEYGFRENHLAILDFLFQNKGKRFSAEQLWNKTEVPKGRIYDFLNELIDWGFLEVKYTKPKTYALRELKEALQSAIKLKEKSLNDVERKTIDIANKLERIWVSELGTKEPKVQLFASAEECYLKLREIVQDSREIKISARTPILFLATERNTLWRWRYYETLLDGIESNKLKLKYAFSLKNTLEITKRKENLAEVLKNIQDIQSNPNVEARAVAGSAVSSLALTDKRALIGFTSPKENMVTSALYIESPQIVTLLNQIYDANFAEASPIDEKIIREFSLS